MTSSLSKKNERLAGLDEKFKVRGIEYNRFNQKEDWSATLMWKEIFGMIAPHLLKFPNDEYVNIILQNGLADRAKITGMNQKIRDEDFQTVTLQLKALGLINVTYSKTITGAMALFWSLTPVGDQLMMDLRTVPSAASVADLPKGLPAGAMALIPSMAPGQARTG